MSHPEQDRRLADRIVCRIPVRLSAGGSVLHTETENFSRVGVLLRVQVTELGLDASATLADVAAALSHTFGDIATAEFRYDVLGGLICRTLRLVRVGRADAESEWFEVGCALRRPISDDEASVLRLPLPPLRRHPAVAVEPSTNGATETYGDSAIQLIVCSSSDHHARPLIAEPRELSARGVRAALVDLRPLPPRVNERGVSSILSALTSGYGANPQVVLMRGSRPVWSGQARIEMVEMYPSGDGVDLQLEFERLLSVPELATLGVN